MSCLWKLECGVECVFIIEESENLDTFVWLRIYKREVWSI